MGSSLTANLQLFKATPGTSEPLRAGADVNSNWDKVDAAIGAPYSDVTQAAASNTASEISMISYLIQPAIPGTIWKMEMCGVYSHSATPTTLTGRVKLGGVTLGAWQITTPASALSSRGWKTEVMMACLTTGVTGTWKTSASGMAVVNTTVTPLLIDGGGTVDTTISKILEFSFQWGAANASNIATLDAGYIRRMTNA